MRSASRAARVIPGASRICGRAAMAVLLCLLAGCGGRTSYYGGYGHGRYSAPGPAEDQWRPYIREAASRFGIPEQWIRAVMHQESGGQEYMHGQLTTSSAGAMGLMQVMPDTYEELRQRYGLGPDPYDPHDNIMAGAAYIREMYDRFGSPGFLAAYNAGPNRVDDYLANGSSLPNETVNYVASIAPNLGDSRPVTGPLAVYAENAPPAEAAPSVPATPAAPVTIAAAAPSTGCDPNAAYDPDAPCTAATAASPAPVTAPATVTTSVLAYQPGQSRPAYDPNAVSAPPVSQPPPPPPQPAMPGIQLAAATTADIPPVRPAGLWSVQVGAFSSPEQARAVAESARGAARDLLGSARIELPMTTPFGHTVLYRARLAGISSNTAALACSRLSGQKLPCMVVPPGQGS
jgi:D-alanyl-D-alanine carboxypeptidase